MITLNNDHKEKHHSFTAKAEVNISGPNYHGDISIYGYGDSNGMALAALVNAYKNLLIKWEGEIRGPVKFVDGLGEEVTIGHHERIL